ncbi:MAG TPA: non-homologous end-joining DNA ligase [Gemmatimonas sp.]|nr:non-homologous end-joining DNA ligase [Gemmatimonas sp.]
MTAAALSPSIALREFRPVALATLDVAPPEGAGWIHEEKLDGYRIGAIRAAESVRLFSRNRKDWTSRFPGVVDAVAALPVRSAVFDGEVVALDQKGVTSFQRLQQSLELHEIRNVRYHLFDLLELDGVDLRELPLAVRRSFLLELLKGAGRGPVLRATREFHPRDGDPLVQACALGIEGVVSKRVDTSYPRGRSPCWIKSKCGRRQEFVVVGYTDPQGSRSHFGALLLGVYDGATLHYAGKVGTGFDVSTLSSIMEELRQLEIRERQITSTVSIPRAGLHWVEPQLVAEIAFTEWTEDGLLRHPVFKGLRLDKPARDVRRED